MARDVEKAISDYNEMVNSTQTTAYKFNVSDYYQIIELSGGNKSSYTGNDFLEAVNNALRFGFVVGYRTAKRENRK